MISKSTALSDAIRQLADHPGVPAGRVEQNVMEALRRRRNGERLVALIREEAGEESLEVVFGFLAEGDEETREFRKASLRRPGGTEFTVSVPPA